MEVDLDVWESTILIHWDKLSLFLTLEEDWSMRSTAIGYDDGLIGMIWINWERLWPDFQRTDVLLDTRNRSIGHVAWSN